MGSIRVYI